MDTTNKYITLAYKLYATMKDGSSKLVEEATEAHPFMFISGMGLTLDAFEAQILPLAKGEHFDFTLSVDEAYGPYVEEGLQTVPRSVFEINGKLDQKYIYEGAVVPLMNSEGERFNGTISQITEKDITVDLNHPLAGKKLQFVGNVVEYRDATNKELESMAKELSGEGGCGGHCGGGKCGNCGDGECGGCGSGECGGCCE